MKAKEGRIMKLWDISTACLSASALAAAIAAFLISPAAIASGSVGAGTGGISQYGDLYKQGKSAFFRKLACNRPECPLKRNEINKELARAIVASLATRVEVKFDESKTDALINRLCPGEGATGCASKVDEQEAVLWYLSLRFGVDQ